MQQFARGFDVLHEVEAVPRTGLKGTQAAGRLRLQALQLARNERLVQAAFTYRVLSLDASAGPTLCVGGEQLEAAALLPASGELTALACCACTIGAGLGKRVRELLAEGRVALAGALRELGAEALAAVTRRAHDRIHADTERAGLVASGELRTGDAGLSAPAQAVLLRLAGAERIAVRSAAAGLLEPGESMALVLGVGRDLPPPDWSRCEDCPKGRTCRVAARTRASRLRG